MKFLILCISLFPFFYANAQSKLNLRFEKIEGLSQNTVYQVLQDNQGFLWIATGDGLNRYDGNSFRVYKPSPTGSAGFIKGRIIRDRLLTDSSDKIWLSTETGVQSLDKQKQHFEFFLPFNDSVKYYGANYQPIALNDAKLWFLNGAFGLLMYDLKKRSFEKFEFPGSLETPSKYYASTGVFDGKETIWISSASGLYSFNVHTRTFTPYLQGMAIGKICISNQKIYFPYKNAVAKFDINTNSHSILPIPFNDVNSEKIICIEADKQNRIWIGGDKGKLYVTNNGFTKMEYVDNVNSANNSRNEFAVYSLYFDQSNQMWIGTDGMGLLKASLSLPRFNSFPALSKTSEHNGIFVTGIYENTLKQTWIAAFRKGLISLDHKDPILSGTAMDLEGVPPDVLKNVSFIKEDHKGNLWIGCLDQLLFKSADESKWHIYKVSPPSALATTRVDMKDIVPFYDKWLLCTNLGVYVVTNSRRGKTISGILIDGDSYLSNVAFAHVVSENEFWIGFTESGIYKLILINGEWKLSEKLFLNEGFNSVWEDEKHQLLWFGTRGGLLAYRMVDGSHRLYTEEDGLLNSFVYGVLEDKNAVWISTNYGLSHIEFDYGSKSFPEIKCRNFTEKNGLQGNEFNSKAFYKSKDGTFYFGGINGLNWFKSKDVIHNPYPPKIATTSISVNDKLFSNEVISDASKSIDFTYQFNTIDLDLAGLEFVNRQGLKFEYQLHGWEKNSVRTANDKVRYANLLPGKYVFTLKAFNEDGVESKKLVRLTINIHPPFWKTWWFYTIELLLLVSAIIFISRYYAIKKVRSTMAELKRQRALGEERKRISKDMHDDIGAGLTQISMMSEAARLHSVSGRENMALSDISHTSRKLVENIGEIIWALNPESAMLQQTLVYLREQLSKMLEYTSMEYHIDYTTPVPDVKLGNSLRRNLLLVSKEIVHNVIKHSKALNVYISVAIKVNSLDVEIRDDGIGFDTTKQYNGNGLKNIRHRIEEQEGDLQVQSNPDKGTTFIYSFPLNTT